MDVGDSGCIVMRQRRIIFKTPIQQHRFNKPYQLGCTSTEFDQPASAQVYFDLHSFMCDFWTSIFSLIVFVSYSSLIYMDNTWNWYFQICVSWLHWFISNYYQFKEKTKNKNKCNLQAMHNDICANTRLVLILFNRATCSPLPCIFSSNTKNNFV